MRWDETRPPLEGDLGLSCEALPALQALPGSVASRYLFTSSRLIWPPQAPTTEDEIGFDEGVTPESMHAKARQASSLRMRAIGAAVCRAAKAVGVSRYAWAVWNIQKATPEKEREGNIQNRGMLPSRERGAPAINLHQVRPRPGGFQIPPLPRPPGAAVRSEGKEKWKTHRPSPCTIHDCTSRAVSPLYLKDKNYAYHECR